MSSIDTEYTLEITPHRRLFDVPIKEILKYRNLITIFVKRDLSIYYKQTVLGPAWFMIQPILSTIVFTIIFTKIANIPTNGIPPFLFYMSGTILWTYFSNCLLQTSNIFIVNANIFSKIYFPRIVLPISFTITNLVTFIIQFGLFLGVLVYYILNGVALNISIWVLLIPLLILQMALLGMGFGMVISCLTTKYRDFIFLLSFGMQLFMYATPIVYPLSQVPESFRWIFALNPMTSIVELFRSVFFGSNIIYQWMIISSIIITIIIFLTGIIMFNYTEKTVVDVV